jgi:hypothetical protein
VTLRSITGTFLGAIAVLLLALCEQAAGAAPVARVQLEDFSTAVALDAWSFKQVEAEVLADAAGARLFYPRGRLWRGKWPAAILQYGQGGFGVQNWSRYERLLFEVYNESTLPALLKLRLDDAHGRRAIRLFNIPAQQRQTCTVDLAGVAAELDIEQVVHFDLYMNRPPVDYSFILDDVRLEAYALDLRQAHLNLDPFGGGRIGVEARLGRKALWQVQVLDEEGGIAAEYTEISALLQWRWEGEELPIGHYQVVLQATDPSWKTASVVRQLGSFEVVSPERRARIAAWREPSSRKIPLHGRPRAGQALVSQDELLAGGAASLQVDMAQNEHEAIQVVFLARDDAVEFSFALEGLRHAASGVAFPVDGNVVYQVGYVHTKKPQAYAVERSGWWPDPLLPNVRMRAEPGACMPIWISLKSKSDTLPGTYAGRLSIQANGASIGFWPLEVRVYAVSLPDTTTIRTAFSLYDHMLERLYGGKMSETVTRRYQEFIADHRLNIDHIYRRTPPDLETLDHFAARGQLNAFCLIYLDAAQKYDRKRLEEIAALLDPQVQELRSRGLVKRAYIYGFDEVSSDRYNSIQRVFGFFKQRYPDVKTMTTAQDPGYGLESGLDAVVDIWVPLSPAYDVAAAEKARARGRQVWWYTCISPLHPYANWFVEYPALEARLLWWMAYQQRVQGFLYYAANRWPAQDELLRLDGGNKTNWNPASFKTANGDGCLFYAGPEGPITTVRFENLRDGIEDYELLHLLAERRGDKGVQSRQFCGELIRSLTDFTRDEEHFSKVRRRLLEEAAQ